MVKENNSLYPTVQFQIRLTPEQEKWLLAISDTQVEVWNFFCEEKAHFYNTNLKSWFDRLSELWKERKAAQKAEDQSKVCSLSKEMDEISGKIKAFQKQIWDLIKKISDAKGVRKKAGSKKPSNEEERLTAELCKLCNGYPPLSWLDLSARLTTLRHERPHLKKVERSIQQSLLLSFEEAHKSFISLRMRGDPRAHPPSFKSGDFCEISSQQGPDGKIRGDWRVGSWYFTMFCDGVFSEGGMIFPIPGYQLKQIDGKRVKSFVIKREPRNIEEPGKYWLSLNYEIAKPDDFPVTRGNLGFIALGANSIGVITPQGEMEWNMSRADWYWLEKRILKPREDSGLSEDADLSERLFYGEGGKSKDRWSLEERLKHGDSVNPVTGRGPNIHAHKKGSPRWKKLHGAKTEMFSSMSDQRKLDRRTKAYRLISTCKHWVISDIVIRSKKGKLADGADKSRSGLKGPNFAAQNTGTIAAFVQVLEWKAKLAGGSVRKHALKAGDMPEEISGSRPTKVEMARALRASYIKATSL